MFQAKICKTATNWNMYWAILGLEGEGWKLKRHLESLQQFEPM